MVAARPKQQLSWESVRRCSIAGRIWSANKVLPKSESKPVRSIAELEAGDPAFTCRNAKLLEQREVLKKSLGILSEALPTGMPESKQ